jgi:alcohol dehydrogenase (NADP+)
MSETARKIATKEDSSTQPQTFTARAYSAQTATSGLAPFTIRRRSPRPQDVQIEILYCGVCHSDLHQVRNEWENTMPTV